MASRYFLQDEEINSSAEDFFNHDNLAENIRSIL